MNNVQRGYSRDSAIVELVERCGVLSTDQIAVLEFGGLQTGQRKAQQRLQRLAASGQLLRSRLPNVPSYVYHLKRLGASAAHRLELNWALVWLVRRCQSWERVAAWDYEPDYGYVRPDLLFVATNAITKRHRAVYVELDRSPRNRWDKVDKYNRLFRDGDYTGAWWVRDAERFPGILVAVTASEARARAIKAQTEAEDLYQLRWDVRMLPALRQEAWPWGGC